MKLLILLLFVVGMFGIAHAQVHQDQGLLDSAYRGLYGINSDVGINDIVPDTGLTDDQQAVIDQYRNTFGLNRNDGSQCGRGCGNINSDSITPPVHPEGSQIIGGSGSADDPFIFEDIVIRIDNIDFDWDRVNEEWGQLEDEAGLDRSEPDGTNDPHNPYGDGSSFENSPYHTRTGDQGFPTYGDGLIGPPTFDQSQNNQANYDQPNWGQDGYHGPWSQGTYNSGNYPRLGDPLLVSFEGEACTERIEADFSNKTTFDLFDVGHDVNLGWIPCEDSFYIFNDNAHTDPDQLWKNNNNQLDDGRELMFHKTKTVYDIIPTLNNPNFKLVDRYMNVYPIEGAKISIHPTECFEDDDYGRGTYSDWVGISTKHFRIICYANNGITYEGKTYTSYATVQGGIHHDCSERDYFFVDTEIHQRVGNIEIAWDQYESGLKTCQESKYGYDLIDLIHWYKGKASVVHKMGDFNTALKMYGWIIETELSHGLTPDPNVLADMGDIFIKAGQDELADYYLGWALKINPEHEHSLRLKGYI